MENLYVAIEWLWVLGLPMVGILAIATGPPWRAIKSALLYMAFGLGATFALILEQVAKLFEFLPESSPNI
jgi:hypothetical protein